MPVAHQPFDVASDVRDRFLRYVQIDTQSKEDADGYPSTAKQLNLSRLLVQELMAIGVSDAQLDEFGYVMATIPSTMPHGTQAPPVLGFLAHVDTSPELPGVGVKPQVVRYLGQPIVLPADPTQLIRPDDNPDLANCLGHDIVTADGTTLLGADDKAGVAEIMAAAAWLVRHPEIPHGVIKLGFTPDEEVGGGTTHFDIAKFGASYAYTLDGSTVGEVEGETFSADLMIVTINGKNAHPGYAKGGLVNSIKLAGRFLAMLPAHALSPETTEDREGYIHPYVITGGVESTVLRVLLRDFEEEGLRAKEGVVRQILADVLRDEARASVTIEVREQYRNMRLVLAEHPHVLAYAEEAVRRCGLEPRQSAIRGGTDGARLSEKGLPTPNLFAGGHKFHSKLEWVSVQDMGKAAEMVVQLAQVWAEHANGA